MKTKSGQEVIAQRKGKELKILYFLRKSARIDKKLDMIEQTIKTVRENFDDLLQNNFKEII